MADLGVSWAHLGPNGITQGSNSSIQGLLRVKGGQLQAKIDLFGVQRCQIEAQMSHFGSRQANLKLKGVKLWLKGAY